MALTYLAPPLLALFASGIAQILGLAAWGLMALAFQPTLRLYRLSPLWGLALPAIALCYMLFTLNSALQFARGKGGQWKGRDPGHGIMSSDAVHIALRQGPPRREFSGRVAAHLIRAIAAPILAFYEFVRIADDMADQPTLKPDEKLALLDRLEAGLLGRHDETARGCRAAHGAARAEPVAAPCPGPLDCVPDGRHQAALSRLGRPDELLHLLGHAGGTLRARCAWRGSVDLAGQRRALRRAADHQSPAGLPGRLPQSRSRLRAARCAGRDRRDGRGAGPRSEHAGAAPVPAQPRRCAPEHSSTKARRSPPASTTSGWPWRLPSSTRWRAVWWRCSARAIR